MMEEDARAAFPGWKSGRGRSVAIVSMSLAEIATVLSAKPMIEADTPYIWFENPIIGPFTIVGGRPGEPNGLSQIFVDQAAKKRDAFMVVLKEVICQLPGEVHFLLEDDDDVDRRMRLQRR